MNDDQLLNYFYSRIPHVIAYVIIAVIVQGILLRTFKKTDEFLLKFYGALWIIMPFWVAGWLLIRIAEMMIWKNGLLRLRNIIQNFKFPERKEKPKQSKGHEFPKARLVKD